MLDGINTSVNRSLNGDLIRGVRGNFNALPMSVVSDRLGVFQRHPPELPERPGAQGAYGDIFANRCASFLRPAHGYVLLFEDWLGQLWLQVNRLPSWRRELAAGCLQPRPRN